MTYRDIIKAEFERRRQLDPFYSLRAYAKELRIQPSHLSDLIQKKKGLSKKKAPLVAAGLGLGSLGAQYFYFLTIEENGRTRAQRNLAKQGLKRQWIEQARLALEMRYQGRRSNGGGHDQNY